MIGPVCMSTACPRVLVGSVDEVAVELTYVWHERPVPAGLEVRQVYGYLLCPHTARVLIQDVRGGKFNLPGGTPELYDADMTATLVREAMEESQVLVTTVVYLGYQEVRRDVGSAVCAGADGWADRPVRVACA
jgi:8-oxo-dGTP pyrophosphatase MutT (NUDIX family)